MTPIPLTESQRIHQKVMYHVVMAMQDTPFILKGGTALLLTRGLPRHSIDLDFDSGKKVNIGKRIQRAMASSGTEILNLTLAKNTNTVQRFKVHYRDNSAGITNMLKIETSFRTNPPDDLVEIVNGIRTYKIESMIEQKIAAVENRTQARDLYDLDYLASAYGDHFTQSQIQKMNALVDNADSLVKHYEVAFKDDRILAEYVQADELVLKLLESIAALHEVPTANTDNVPTAHREVSRKESLRNEDKKKVTPGTPRLKLGR